MHQNLHVRFVCKYKLSQKCVLLVWLFEKRYQVRLFLKHPFAKLFRWLARPFGDVMAMMRRERARET